MMLVVIIDDDGNCDDDGWRVFTIVVIAFHMNIYT